MKEPEEDAPQKSKLEQQMENAWNNDDDKDMEALAKETAKKSMVNKPKLDAKVQLEDELFMKWATKENLAVLILLLLFI